MKIRSRARSSKTRLFRQVVHHQQLIYTKNTACMELQIVLIFILAILTVTLVGVGIYIILVLKELRETIQKANLIIDDVETLTNVVSNPLSIVSGLVKGYQAIKNLQKED